VKHLNHLLLDFILESGLVSVLSDRYKKSSGNQRNVVVTRESRRQLYRLEEEIGKFIHQYYIAGMNSKVSDEDDEGAMWSN
jgi:hypothetical protein